MFLLVVFRTLLQLEVLHRLIYTFTQSINVSLDIADRVDKEMSTTTSY